MKANIRCSFALAAGWLCLAALSNAATIGIGEATATAHGPASIPVTISADAAPATLHLCLTYDPAVLESPGAQAGPLMTGAHVVEAFSPEPGKLNVVVYPQTGASAFASASGVACYLTFQVKFRPVAGFTPVVFASDAPGSPSTPASSLSDLNGQSIGHTSQGGQVDIIQTGASHWTLFD